MWYPYAGWGTHSKHVEQKIRKSDISWSIFIQINNTLPVEFCLNIRSNLLEITDGSFVVILFTRNGFRTVRGFAHFCSLRLTFPKKRNHLPPVNTLIYCPNLAIMFPQTRKLMHCICQQSLIGIATRYGLDVSGF